MEDNPYFSDLSTDSDESYTNRDTQLITACKMQDLPQVRGILASPGININARADGGYTALDCAIIGNRRTFQQEIVQALLAVPGIDVNSRDDNGNTALFWAVGRGRRETIQALLERQDTNVNARDNAGNSIVMRAVRRGPAAPIDVLTDILADPRIDVNAANGEGDTPLIIAVIFGRTETVQALLERQDINVNARDSDGNSPLFLAFRNWYTTNTRGYLAIARLLLGKQGIEVDPSVAELLRANGYSQTASQSGGINKKRNKSKRNKSKRNKSKKSRKNKK
jgi:hypothetical protein